MIGLDPKVDLLLGANIAFIGYIINNDLWKIKAE